jgi:hypothetical protein
MGRSRTVFSLPALAALAVLAVLATYLPLATWWSSTAATRFSDWLDENVVVLHVLKHLNQPGL